MFINWRGLLAPPASRRRRDELIAYFETMHDTDDWRTRSTRTAGPTTSRPATEFGAFLEDQDKRVSTTLTELRLL